MPRGLVPKINVERSAAVVKALRTYHSNATALDQQLAARAGLSTSDLRCVDLLDLHGGRLSAGKLAEAANLTTGAVTGVVDRLERAGLVVRVADPNDRRRVLVELAEASRDRGRAQYAELMDAERAHLSGLTGPQLAVLLDFLEAEARWVRARAEALRDGAGAALDQS